MGEEGRGCVVDPERRVRRGRGPLVGRTARVRGRTGQTTARRRADQFPPLKQPGGKIITAFAVRGDLDLDGTVSNTFTLEWPKGSGNVREYPEIDRVGWFGVAEARSKLLKGQRPLLERLLDAVEGGGPTASQ